MRASRTSSGPGHADYAYFMKYGVRDYRGGGRQSARETAARVAAGAIARKVLDHIVHGRSPDSRRADPSWAAQSGPWNWDWAEVERNAFWSPDAKAAALWESYIDERRKAGSSCGAVIEVVAENVPAGLGAPVYGKLDADLAAAMMSINAVKGVEIGAGFAAAALSRAKRTRTRCG